MMDLKCELTGQARLEESSKSGIREHVSSQ